MYTERNFWATLIRSLMLTAVAIGLVIAAWWSFEQTVEFAGLALASSMRYPIGSIIQFGQNAALYARNKTSNPNERIMWMGVFLFLGFIDALTNLGQWFVDHANVAVTDIPSAIAMGVGFFFCIGVIFVEEMFVVVFALTLHSWNETLKAAGASGLSILDLAAKSSSNFGMFPEKGPKGNGGQKPQQQKRPEWTKHDKPSQEPRHPQTLRPGDRAMKPQLEDDFEDEDVDEPEVRPPTGAIRLADGREIKLNPPKKK